MSEKNVKARYLGQTPVVFRHLADAGDGPHAGECYVIRADGEREFRPLGAELAEGESYLAKDASALVVEGDVLSIDADSAEARSDLEVVKASTKTKES